MMKHQIVIRDVDGMKHASLPLDGDASSSASHVGVALAEANGRINIPICDDPQTARFFPVSRIAYVDVSEWEADDE